MRITDIIALKKSSKVLKEVAELVKTARKVYGNKDAEITVPGVNTTAGCTSIKYLSADDRAAVAKQELRGIITQINNMDASIEGVVPDYEVIALVSTNAVLCNLDTSISSKLI